MTRPPLPHELIAALKAEGIIQYQRENSDTMWWLTDESQRFLSFHGDTVTLWQSNRPFAANDVIDTMPLEQADPVTVACMISPGFQSRDLSQAW